MPYPNQHAARVKSPNLFIRESIRSKQLSSGVRLIAGKLKSNPTKMTAQSYRFDKSSFTVEQAKKWLSDNGIKYISFEAAIKNVQSFEREIKLQCYALKLSPEEIKSHVPINVMAELKQSNPHPYLRAYSIMHDGIAKPRVIGEDKALPTKWSRKVVESLKGVVKRGVQFFIGHNSDNSTKGRKSIGEVVGNFQKMIGDKLHNIVIGYFPDKLEADKYNVCSIEGNVLAQDFEDYSIIRQIKNISGIALGNSNYEKPAFPGAVYLGAVQAFDDNVDDNLPSKNKREEITIMTFEEIKKAVRDMNIHAHQLYTEDDLKADRAFGKIFDQVTNVTKELSDARKELDGRGEEVKKLQKELTTFTAQDKLIKSLPEGLTDSQKTFISKEFKPETIDDLSDNYIKEFIDNSLKKYSEYASVFGKAEEKENQDDNSNDSDKDQNSDTIDEIVNEVVKQPQGV